VPRVEARRRKRFIVDSMLGGLARWLRMLGYDTLYAKNWHDARILEVAESEGRAVVTRDHGLYVRAVKRGLEAVIVPEELEDALAILALRFGIELKVDPDRSRCPLCNASLRRASAEEVKGRVPPQVLERHSVFWVCTGCGQVYWRGGHWRGIEATLAEARKRLERLRGGGG